MVQISKNCFFIIMFKKKMDVKMKSFSDDVKNYYTFTTIKHILDDIHLKNQDITISTQPLKKDFTGTL